MKVVFWQGFMLTFLGEWGDKSQFSTITMSAAGDAFYVFLGASSALFISTMSAVLAGQFISKHISEPKMNLAGGILFLVFGVLTTYGIYERY
jgi:putative Ca2+/H+ antiporter (TMEM165/GDT1 family)